MAAKKVAKKTKKNFVKKALENPKVWKFLVKVTLFSLFFITAFNAANTQFFNDNPIWGVRFLAEILIGLAAGVFGFHTVPIIWQKIGVWFEKIVTGVVTNIVSDFWSQQAKRMQDAKRSKQKQKKKEREKQTTERFKTATLLDTSVLIDGRVVDLVKTGFFEEELIVPQGVLDELHLISDSDDELKRKKGRRGLDILNELKKVTKVKVFKVFGDISKDDGVDKELLRLAKKYQGRLMTMDFNLNKVAKAGNVKVLNLNELATAIRHNAIPGEKIKIKIVQKGRGKNQGVGYLDDGTMVVVAGAKDKVDKKLAVTVTKVIQTEAGKMVFCEL